MKETIFFDFDDTLIRTNDALLSFLDEEFSVKIPRDRFNCSHNLHNIVDEFLDKPHGLSREEFYSVFEKFASSLKWHERLTVSQKDKDAIRCLKSKYTLCIVTARRDSSKSVVSHLLEKHYPGSFENIHFVWQNTEGEMVKFTKSKFIDEFDGIPVAHIDDNPKELFSTSRLVKPILIDTQNFHSSISDFTRVSSLSELCDIFL